MRVLLSLMVVCSLTGSLFGQVVAQPLPAPAPPAAPADAKEKNEPPSLRDLDRDLLQRAGLPLDPEKLLDFIRNRTLSPMKQARVELLIQKFASEDFDVRESATDEIIEIGIPAVRLLKLHERDENYEVAWRVERCLRRIEKVPTGPLTLAVVRTLAELKSPATIPTLLTYLPAADDDDLTEAIVATLTTLAPSSEGTNPLILRALDDADPLRRAGAAEVIARCGTPAERKELRARFDKEKYPGVRLRVALALLGSTKDQSLIPEMIRLLGEPQLEQAWKIEEALCKLAGDGMPNVTLTSDPEQRRKCRDAWQAWYEKNQGRLDLKRLEVPALLGYTIVMEMNLRGAGSDIVEIGPDKKERWKLTGLNNPLAAIVLSNGRVIVAEHNIHQLSERDLDGKIIWRKQLQTPVSLQRLPNGSIIAAGRSQLIELDSERKEVFKMDRPHDLIAARKTRDNHYLLLTMNQNTGMGQIMRCDATGKEIKTITTQRINYYGDIDIVSPTRVLITEWNGVAEYDLEKGQRTAFLSYANPSSVQRLPNGNTLVTSMNTRRVVELDPSGKTVWEYTPTDNSRPWRAYRR